MIEDNFAIFSFNSILIAANEQGFALLGNITSVSLG
jgi:hypothetical protein